MTFIKLTKTDDRPVYVNPKYISSFFPTHEQHNENSRMFIVGVEYNNTYCEVLKETPEEIIEKIKEVE